jgi:integrase
MASNILTTKAVEAKRARGRYSDGEGLVLQVSKWGTKSWVFRYKRGGRDRHMGLGPVDALSLADARERARKCRRLLLDDLDPIEQRKGERQRLRLEAARGLTFMACAESYVEAHAAAWRNAKHRAQWGSTLETYAYPVIGELAVAAIDTALVLKCLEPIWVSKPETAKRLRGRIENILNWATVRGHRVGDNPARWRGHIDQLLPAPGKVRAVKHHAAMSYADLALFMGELRERGDVGARALELAVLTALRTGEVIGAEWAEIDLGAKVWTVPAVRMKTAREHRVPLSRRALDILGAMARESNFVFSGGRKGQPLSNMAMLKTLERMGYGDVTVHGFRSTFRDWAAETTGYPNHVVEMALAHAVGDKVEAAYRRGDLFEKRRRLMDEWARYCARPAVAGDIVALRGGRAVQ